jgi:hypothetical protein
MLQYKGIEPTSLGEGINLVTGAHKYTGAIESKMIDDEGNSGIIAANSEYEDIASFTSTKTDTTSAYKIKYEGAAAVSYGLLKGKAKIAYETAKANASSDGTIHKIVGMVRKKIYHLPYSYRHGEPNNISREKTAQILLSSSSALSKSIAEINQATGLRRRQCIAEFYQEYGTHVVTSVTKGYIGYYEMTLTFIGSQEEKSTSFAKSVSASYAGFTSVSGGYSKADSNTFSQGDYRYESRTYVSPDNKETLETLSTLKADIDNAIKAAKEVFEFKNVAINIEKLNYPTFPDVEIDQEAKEEAKQRRSLKKKMENNLNILFENTNKVNAELKKIKKEQSPENRRKVIEEIRKILENSIKPILDQFLSGGDYSELSLSRKNSNKIQKARMLYDKLSENANITTEELDELNQSLDDLEKAQEKAAAQAEKAQEQKDKIVFSNWLKNIYYPEQKGECNSFNEWFEKQTLEGIKGAQKEWEKTLKKSGLIEKEPLTENSQHYDPEQLFEQERIGLRSLQTSQIWQSNVLVHGTAPMLSKTEGSSSLSDLTTLDYDIVPWHEIFLELTFVPADDYKNVFLAKACSKFNDFLETRIYLKFVKNILQESKKLDEYYTEDEPLENQITEILKNWYKALTEENQSSVSTLILIEDRRYDIATEAGVKNLESKIDEIIQKSKMVKSDWYKCVQKLKEIGLIKPYGALFATAKKGQEKKDGEFSNEKLRIANIDQYMGKMFPCGPSDICTQKMLEKMTEAAPPYKRKTFGQQLSEITRGNIPLSAVIPLVTENSKEDLDKVTEIFIYLINTGSTMPLVTSLTLSTENKNTPTEPVYCVHDVANITFASLLYYENMSTIYITGSQAKDKELVDCLYSQQILKEPCPMERESFTTTGSYDVVLIPINSYIMTSFDSSLSKDKHPMMTLCYGNFTSLPTTLFKLMFGE